MDFKTVPKSKSSNAAMDTKSDNNTNKAFFSNAKLQTSVVKKRGVYVEKKIQSSTDTQEANNKIQIHKKPPRRPPPGQKKFLTSVLTILSKSTTGTQHPEIQDTEKETKTRCKPQWKKTNDSQSRLIQKTKLTKKTKYRSRVLNDEMLKAEQDQLVVLQSRRDIVQTPSNNSDNVKLASDLFKLTDENEPKRNTIREILENNIYSGVAEGITKEVLEGKPKKEKKLRIMDEPETIAAELAKNDDKMYNFFVDLLETTISVYNVKTEHNISNISKTTFEIDDSVVKKLEIKKDIPSTEKISVKSKLQTNTANTFDVSENIPIDVNPSVYKRHSPFKPRIKAKSFLSAYNYTRKAKSVQDSKSFETNNKCIKKPNKKKIINLLKQELQKDTFTYREPETLYDALRVMAKNKKRNEKSIHFVSKINIRHNSLDSECMFERQKVFGTKKKNKIAHNRLQTSVFRNNQYELETSNRYVPSSHSLKVCGYDYEPVKLSQNRRETRIVYHCHSSPTNSDSNLEEYNALKLNNQLHSNSSSSLSVFN